jgi:hypothetical protein
MNNTMNKTIKSINNEYNIDSNSINFNTLNNTDKNKQKKYIEVKNIYQFEILGHKLHTIIYNLNKQNIIIVREFNKLLKTIVNSFHILLHNSSLCSYNKDDKSIIYTTSDYSITQTYSILNDCAKNNNHDLYLFIDNFINTNKIEFKNYNNFLKDLSNNNDNNNDNDNNNNDNNNDNKDTIINTTNEFIKIIQSFDMSDKLNEFYNPIYINYMNLYKIAQTTLQKACDNSAHNINNNVKTLIFDELKNARLLFHQIKDKIQELNLNTPKLTNHIDKYVTSCKTIIDLYNH